MPRGLEMVSHGLDGVSERCLSPFFGGRLSGKFARARRRMSEDIDYRS